MGFNIGSQHARVINNVEGDQTVHVQQVSDGAGTANELADLVSQLREALLALPLPPDVGPEVQAELDALDADIARPEPDRQMVADRLTRISRLLSAAGSLLTAGTGLLTPLSALATLLGALGGPIRQILGL